ncbi:TetR/AcrR family transcriptional regulator [Streptomyces pactum]|uniref:TetR/AcrR family transcriptional regulator n=1 Tax=Streptomyces pactum TaxID=68249 RepID=A0ABS0NE02_9ACTN|nr:TetR/AcrR family transcriptional regulator [Streptomyces pactum]MBH5333428.1 TetR/AcrR family transcriptional regulator [Streptomyces pactum]
MARPREFDEDRVVTAAMETFWRHGYEGTSTRELCESTGLNPSSLYNAFGGKRRLYLRALHRYHETSTGEQIALLRQPGPARERLRRMMIHAIDADLDDGPGCFAVNAAVEAGATDPEVRAAVRRSFDRVEDELYAVLTTGQRTGEIPAGRDARTLARQVQSTYYGLRVLSRVSTDRQALVATVELTLAQL